MDARGHDWERLGAALAAVLTGAVGLYREFRNGATDAHGSAGFEAPSADFLFPRKGPLPATAFLLSGRRFGGRVAVPPQLAMRHGIVLGGTGTGKSRGYFLPNAALKRDASLVCSDPKGELWQTTSGLHKEAWRFAPTEPQASLPFNWIPLCGEARIAEALARAVMEAGNTQRTEQVWLDLETGFLSAVFSHASTLAVPTPLSAFRLITHLSAEDLIKELAGSPSEIAQEQAGVLKEANDRMRGNFVPAVAARMRFMRDPDVQRFTSSTLEAPDLRLLRQRPIALYWCLHENDVARLRPLSNLFFALLFEATTRGTQEPSPSLPLIMLLDEFANVGAVPDFDTIASVARGRGVSLWLGLHALSQLDERYGPIKARSILANMATKIALSGLDVEICEWVSRALGEETRHGSRESWHRQGLSPLPLSTTSAQNDHGRRLLTPDEVRRIGEEEALVLVANKRPLRLKRPFYGQPPRTAFAPSLGPALKQEGPQTMPEEMPPPPLFMNG